MTRLQVRPQRARRLQRTGTGVQPLILTPLRRRLVWNSAMRCLDLLPASLEPMPTCRGEGVKPAEDRAAVHA
jgi:hypothetical protein